MRLSGATGVIGTSLRDMPMGFGGELRYLALLSVAHFHPQKHAGAYRRALPSDSLGQVGIEKPGADCLQWSGGGEKMTCERGWYGKSAPALL